MIAGASVAVAIPAYEAADTVGDVVRRADREVEHVLVIDDGSRDATGRVAREAGARVIALPRNRGKGCALKTAFDDLFARGFEAVITLDADGQHEPEEIPRLLAAWQPGVHLVLATRHHQFREMGRVRRASNRLSTRAISLLAGISLGDIQTGFRLYTRRLIEATRFPERRFDAESAVVVRAARRGFTIVGVPVRSGEVDGRSTSHYRPVVDSMRIARSVIRARFEDAS